MGDSCIRGVRIQLLEHLIVDGVDLAVSVHIVNLLCRIRCSAIVSAEVDTEYRRNDLAALAGLAEMKPVGNHLGLLGLGYLGKFRQALLLGQHPLERRPGVVNHQVGIPRLEEATGIGATLAANMLPGVHAGRAFALGDRQSQQRLGRSNPHQLRADRLMLDLLDLLAVAVVNVDVASRVNLGDSTTHPLAVAQPAHPAEHVNELSVPTSGMQQRIPMATSSDHSFDGIPASARILIQLFDTQRRVNVVEHTLLDGTLHQMMPSA